MRICDSQFKQNKTANGNPYTYLAISVMQSWRGAHASNGFVLIRYIQIWKILRYEMKKETNLFNNGI